MNRTFLKTETRQLADEYGWPYEGEVREQVATGDPAASLVSSLLVGSHNIHAPALDIDFPATLVPSSTPGHFHLYLDCPMPWRRYRRLLRALARAGIIERSWYKAAVYRRATHLRIRPNKGGML